jgi:butyrate kinase
MAHERILAINLGSTSTKVAVYEGEREVFKENLRHGGEELAKYPDIWDQAEFRKAAILTALEERGIERGSIAIIASRGGNTHPIPGGIYRINESMLVEMRSGKYGTHPTNVGGEIAFRLGAELGITVVTVDPPVTDELEDAARYSGVKEIPRVSSFHALSQKSTARKLAARVLGKRYEELNLIVAHLGGGISVGAHRNGRVIDVNNALDGDGPFSPERAGTVPAGDLIRMCCSGRYTESEMMRKIRGGGGLMSHLGTNDAQEVERRIERGDEEARGVYLAMAYRVAREIGAAAASLCGRVDLIALTGSLAYSDLFVSELRRYVSFIAPVEVDPGENEMRALAEGALRVLRGEEAAKEFTAAVEEQAANR